MIMSSRLCTVESCKRIVTTRCIDCEQHFCIIHLNEHSNMLITQCAQLSDTINKISEQINNASSLSPCLLSELDRWRKQAHQEIDNFCEKKKKEFDEIVDINQLHQMTELARLRDRITQSIEEKTVTENFIDLTNDSIKSLQRQANQSQIPQLILSPLVIDDNLIVIRQSTSSCQNLLPLPIPQQTKQLKDNYLRAKHDSNSCILDEQFNVVKSTPWTGDIICDMFWSNSLGLFILITCDRIFTLNDESMIINQLPIIWNDKSKYWHCGTCTNDCLFLLATRAKASIYKYSLSSEMPLIREYRPPISCIGYSY